MLLLLVCAAIGMGGCGIPRMISYETRIQDPNLVIPGGTRIYANIQPDVVFLYGMGNTTRIHSPRTPEETFAWYQQSFAAKGWTWDEISPTQRATLAEGANVPRDQAGVWNFRATRDTTWNFSSETIPITQESIDLHMDMGYRDEQPTGCYVDIKLSIQSIWDWPSRIGVGLVLVPATFVVQEGVLLLQPIYIWF